MTAKVRNTEMINTRVPISAVDMVPSINDGPTLTATETPDPDLESVVSADANHPRALSRVPFDLHYRPTPWLVRSAV